MIHNFFNPFFVVVSFLGIMLYNWLYSELYENLTVRKKWKEDVKASSEESRVTTQTHPPLLNTWRIIAKSTCEVFFFFVFFFAFLYNIVCTP